MDFADCYLQINRGSNTSAHILLNLFNELGKGIKCEACNEFNKFNYTGARILDSFYHIPLICFGEKTSTLCHLLRNAIMDFIMCCYTSTKRFEA